MEVPDSRRRLTLLDATCIMLGIVVGSGIFRMPAEVAKMVPATVAFLSVWIAGGIASLLGALCFAELSARYPEDGGSYAFLTRAFGPSAGFLFAWTDFWIVRPANGCAVALVLGAYAQQVLPLNYGGALGYAVASIVVVTAIHLCGVHLGRWSQNAMSLAKLLGLLAIVVVAFVAFPPAPTMTAPSGGSWSGWPGAFVLVMFAYGGWSDLSNVAAEVREPARNMLRALVVGVLAIMATYLAVNLAALHALGIDRLASTPAFAEQIAAGIGSGRSLSSALIAILVVVCCLGSISGVVFTGARVYYALGLQRAGFAWLGGWNVRRSTPSQALIAQAVVSCLLLFIAGQSDQGFQRLVIFAGPCYWGFALLTTVALMLLRRADSTTPLPFRVPMYPIIPLAFIALCGLLVVASSLYVLANLSLEAWYTAAVLASGVGVAFWTRRR